MWAQAAPSLVDGFESETWPVGGQSRSRQDSVVPGHGLTRPRLTRQVAAEELALVHNLRKMVKNDWVSMCHSSEFSVSDHTHRKFLYLP